MRFRKTIIHESDRNNESGPSREVKNVVVFGESGVGKSSLINLLAGEKVSETSSGTLGCMLEYKRHRLELDHQQFAVWDTAGLDEGTQGSVPADKAEAYLKQLLHELAKNNGIDLLVYCVHGSRVRSALLTNYHIFYSAICRKKVPITIVITGLENQEGDMETWWKKNEVQFSLLKMYFNNHACVTTLDQTFMKNPLLKERREISRAVVIKMITTTCRTQQWKPPERSWVESACSDIRGLLSPRDARIPAVIMCETFKDSPNSRRTRKRTISFHNPVAFTLSANPLNFRNPVSVSNHNLQNKLPFEEGVRCTPERLYRTYRVSPKPAPRNTDKEAKALTIVKRGADLLIFCVRMEESEPRDVRSQWDHFNFTYGGDLAPQVVVVVGAPDQSAAEMWWKEAVGTLVKNDVNVTYWPSDTTGTAAEVEVEAARRRLQHIIQDRCIDYSRAGNERLLRKSLFPDLSDLWGGSKSNGKGNVPGLEPDMLTRAGVWYGVAERSSSIARPVSRMSLP